MRSVRFVLVLIAMTLTVSIVHADETRGHAMLNQARSGAQAMEAYYEILRMGESGAAEEKRQEAQELFERVTQWGMSVEPESFDAASDAAQYAEAMQLAGQHDLAARGYHRAHTLEPQDVYALGAARNYRRISPAWFDEAVDLLVPLAEDTSNAGVHAELAHIYQATSLIDLASVSWDRALELDPESRHARLGKAIIDIAHARVAEGNAALTELGQLEINLGRYLDETLPDALARIERRQLSFPETAVSNAAYAQLLVRVGRNFDALMAIERATTLDDSNYSWFNMQGGLLMQQGFTDRAAAAYRKSLALNSNQPRTRQMLQQLENPPN